MASKSTKGKSNKLPDDDQTVSSYFQDGRHSASSVQTRSATSSAAAASLSPETLKSLIKECLQDLELKVNGISNTTDTILAEQKQLFERVSVVESRCDEFEKTIQYSSDEVDALRGKCRNLEAQLHDVGGELVKAKQQLSDLSESYLDQERFSRSYNLRFGGISESENENCVELIKDIVSEKFKMADVTIDNAHRVPRRVSPKAKGPRHILVKFPLRVQRNKILAMKKTALTGSDIFVSADLCQIDYSVKKNLKMVMEAAYKEGKKVKFVKGKLYINNKLYERPS